MENVIDPHVLKARREAKGWDQVRLAHEAGINSSVISRLERGLQSDLKASVLIALARALNAPIADLLLLPAQQEVQEISPELAALIAEIAHLSPAVQRHIGAVLRTYLSALPPDWSTSTDGS